MTKMANRGVTSMSARQAGLAKELTLRKFATAIVEVVVHVMLPFSPDDNPSRQMRLRHRELAERARSAITPTTSSAPRAGGEFESELTSIGMELAQALAEDGCEDASARVQAAVNGLTFRLPDEQPTHLEPDLVLPEHPLRTRRGRIYGFWR